MKLQIILLAGLLFSIQASAQVEGLSIGKKNIDTSAILEVSAPANDKGVLLPRMTSFQRESIATPAAGLLIFDTGQNEFYFYDGSQWQSLNHFKYRKGSNAVDEEHLTATLGNNRNIGITNRLAVGDEVFVKEAIAENSMAVQGNITVKENLVVEGTTTATGNITTQGQFEGYGITPKGGIIMWSGNAASVPDGWALCNGQVLNGFTTPDLSGKFIAGYSETGAYSNAGNLSTRGTTTSTTGGEETHILSIEEIPSHNHYGSVSSVGNHNHYITKEATSDSELRWQSRNSTMATHTDAGTNEEYRLRSQSRYRADIGLSSDAGGHSHTVKWDGGSNTNGGAQPGTTLAHENRPPFYVLAFIMRVK